MFPAFAGNNKNEVDRAIINEVVACFIGSRKSNLYRALSAGSLNGGAYTT